MKKTLKTLALGLVLGCSPLEKIVEPEPPPIEDTSPRWESLQAYVCPNTDECLPLAPNDTLYFVPNFYLHRHFMKNIDSLKIDWNVNYGSDSVPLWATNEHTVPADTNETWIIFNLEYLGRYNLKYTLIKNEGRQTRDTILTFRGVEK